MRSDDEIREVFRLAATGCSNADIARRVGLARSTVRAWLRAGEFSTLSAPTRTDRRCSGPGRCDRADDVAPAAYAYLLGQYLGDGCVSRVRASFKLRITCCTAYPGIMAECAEAIRRIRPGGRVCFVPRGGCTEVVNYWRHWPCLVPHGVGGVKHRRSITLVDWQRRMAIDEHPGLFVRGLIHSDGWRGVNRVRGAQGRRYAYPRYQFSNRSEDIRSLFVEACNQLGVRARRMNAFTISVADWRSVAILDAFVGLKA